MNEFFFTMKEKLNKAGRALVSMVFLLTGAANAQITYTFTAAGATGAVGPTAVQVSTTYISTNLNGLVTGIGGIQSFTVPTNGLYTINAYGARGGGNFCGLGARMQGEFNLTAGTVLNILVGQQGGTNDASHGSGGGGSFVAYSNNVLLIAAGGGGGKGASQFATQTHCDGTTAINGQSPPGGAPAGTGGGGGAGASGSTGGTSVTPGSDASSSVWASGGGGYYTNGGKYNNSSLFGGRSFLNGGLGGDAGWGANYQGGFGGGGGAGDRGAGGGGYSGGGGGTNDSYGGGGGGSYNNGANQVNQSGINNGNGYVVISLNCTPGSAPTDITQASYLTICSGYATTLTVSGAGTINWYPTFNSTTVLGSGPTYVTPILSAGNYTYYAASTNTCGEGPRTPVVVTVVPALPLMVSGAGSMVCPGSSVLLTASGADTYNWSTGATTSTVSVVVNTNTFFTVMGTSTVSGCTGFSVKTVSVFPLNPITALGSGTICMGQQINLAANGALTYTWEPGSMPGFFVTVAPPSTTIYTVTGTDANGCTNSSTVTVMVNVCNGLQNNDAGEGIRLYPNPTSGSFVIELNGNSAKAIDIMDVTGRVLLSEKNVNDTLSVNMASFSNGIYFVKIETDDTTRIMKVVKH